MSGTGCQKWWSSLAALFVSIYCTGCSAEQVPLDWKTECVGRYQISVPGEVEIALTTMRKFYKPNDTPIAYFYSDGNSASHSEFNGMLISEKISIEEFEKFKQYELLENKKLREKLVQEAEARSTESLRQDELRQAAQSKALQFKSSNVFGWEFREGMDLYQFHDGHIYYYRQSALRSFTEKEEISPNFNPYVFEREIAQAGLDSFLKAFRPRKLYEMPTSTGICLPYAFITDNGNGRRDVAVTMRLKNHPDVEIFLHDRSAYKQSSNLDFSDKKEIAYFWHLMTKTSVKEVRLDFPPYRSTKLDGRDGAYSFGEITRLDDSQDFGYVAYVKGNPDAAIDTPNLMLHVFRTASRAKGKPVSKTELKDMAKKIAASVRRHH